MQSMESLPKSSWSKQTHLLFIATCLLLPSVLSTDVKYCGQFPLHSTSLTVFTLFLFKKKNSFFLSLIFIFIPYCVLEILLVEEFLALFNWFLVHSVVTVSIYLILALKVFNFWIPNNQKDKNPCVFVTFLNGKQGAKR
uniref:Putative phosphatidylglycerol/phosphatidylinositol transfer protein DDB_G0282107 n=1 Tax=Rhizophora mucronata TaxID=61149 RepID=A0A2P2JV58_RHIMU